MNRKDFLKNILLGSAGAMVTAPLPAAAEPSRQKIRLAVTFIAGFQHYDGPRGIIAARNRHAFAA